ncbi:MAG: NAD-dependent epimerase/dehydratase family protein [bacterium]|nr:NAD-dependent epimerase/dehydratase family protein [bacterium]
MIEEFAREMRALRGPILVTGASGFIGANLARALASVRDDVVAVALHDGAWRLAGTSVPLRHADVRDPAAVRDLVASVRPAIVFDCAAYGAYPGQSEIERIYATNVVALATLTEALAASDLVAFVHAGSSSEYGTNASAPSESAPCEPNSHYAVSKLAAAEHLRYMGTQRGFPCVNLRLYAVYGVLEDTSRLVPQLVRAGLAGGYPPLASPEITRDFVYVDDVVRAFVRAAYAMRPELYGASINIGTGRPTTLAELAAISRDVFALAREPEFGGYSARSWDVHAPWYADPRRAAEAIDWHPNVSLDEGLRATARWIETLDNASFAAASAGAAPRKRSVSAIVACYRDAQAIPVMHERLTAVFRRLDVPYEIIFVDDGSPDDGAEVIRALSARDPHVTGISHARNFGSQMAFRSGMELATGDAIVLLDGDLQDPPELIEAFYARYEEGYDVVYGRRDRRDMPRAREAAYKLFYRLFAATSAVPMPLDAGDFSLMDRRVVTWLLACSERDLFLRGLRAYVGFKQIGVPYVRPERAFGRSTNDLGRNLDWAKRAIFSFSGAPLTLLMNAGFALLVLSFVAAAIEAVLRIAIPTIAPRGITTVLVVTLFFGGLNLFAVGLVGEYVAKVLTEVKARPGFIRAARLRGGRRYDEPRDLLPPRSLT